MASDTNHHSEHNYARYELVIILVIAVIMAGLINYFHQQVGVNALQTQENSLNTKLDALRTQKSQLQAARLIPMKNWKPACDTANNLCILVPPLWNPASFIISTYSWGSIVGLDSFNPTKTLELSYRNHYFNDSGWATFHVVSISKLSSKGLALQVVGGYYVAENRQPFYIVVNPSQISNFGDPLQAGQNVEWANNQRFEMSQTGTSSSNDAIRFVINPYNKVFPTEQSANAWFTSVDGLTSLKIAQSLAIDSAQNQ